MVFFMQKKSGVGLNTLKKMVIKCLVSGESYFMYFNTEIVEFARNLVLIW